VIERRPTFAPFANPDFRLLWTATVISQLGGLIQTVGAGWLMTSLTDSHQLIALVQASNTLPIMVLSLIAGALADNFPRRIILIWAQVFLFTASVALSVVAFWGTMTPWLLLSFTFLIGCGTALYNPSWQASMGDIVEREDLPQAVSLNSMGFNMMRSVGPAIGGAVVAAFGAAAAFAINAASYLPLLGALMRWRPAYPERRLPRESLRAALSSGLRYVAMSPNLMRAMARAGLFGFGACAVLALLPMVARDLLHGTALTYGITLGAFGLGAIGGVMLNGPLRARLRNESIVRGGCLVFAVGLVALGLSRSLWMTAPALLICGGAWVMSLSLFNVTVQLSSPRWVVGRALSFYQTAAFGGMTVGAWVWGAVADAGGVSLALYFAAGALVLAALSGLWLAVGEFGGLSLDPVGPFNAPPLRLDLRGRSGPIMVMIDYRIAEEDVPAFLEVMQERRRIRRRDGARAWALLRDLEDPDIWVESYHVATWVEYIRHVERRTKADLANLERLQALHRGPGKPVVHRMIERHSIPHPGEMVLKPGPDLP
jgi:predicted MFS family arabinose efflux permease